jgi:hypothetical protein
MPEAMLWCEKCQGIKLHELNANDEALCLGCYDIKHWRPKCQPRAETMRQGKQERA